MNRTQTKPSLWQKILGRVQKTAPHKQALTKVSPAAHVAKATHNPLISPREHHEWESWQTFNPGAAVIDDVTHFLYRAIGADGVSRLGYACSRDGVHLFDRCPFPVFEEGLCVALPRLCHLSGGWPCGGSAAEDPRITFIEEDGRIYVTYTSLEHGIGVALTSIAKEDFLKGNWNWTPPIHLSAKDEVHKNWVLFPEKIHGKYALLHTLSPEIGIAYLDSLEEALPEAVKSSYRNEPPQGAWEAWVRGAGAPPLKTEHGWLLFYHGMEEGGFHQYKVGAMLLDLDDPTIIRYRSSEPILAPEEHYENEGFKSGVVYVSGATIRDNTVHLYYGGADSFVNVATAPLQKLLHAIMNSTVAPERVAVSQ